MWNVKAKMIPVIIWANWTHFKITHTIPDQHTGKHEIRELQKPSHIVHCTLTAGSADVEVQNIFNVGNNITCSANCKYTTAATLYTVEMWFV